MPYSNPSASIKFLIRNFLYSIGLFAVAFFANGQDSRYDNIWEKVVLYENDESSVIQKFSLTGRLQADYHSFENDENGVSG